MRIRATLRPPTRQHLFATLGTGCASGIFGFGKLLAGYLPEVDVPTAAASEEPSIDVYMSDSEFLTTVITRSQEDNTLTASQLIRIEEPTLGTRRFSHRTSGRAQKSVQPLSGKEFSDAVAVFLLKRVKPGSGGKSSLLTQLRVPPSQRIIKEVFRAPPDGPNSCDQRRLRSRFFPLMCRGVLSNSNATPQERFRPRVVGYTLKPGKFAPPVSTATSPANELSCFLEAAYRSAVPSNFDTEAYADMAESAACFEGMDALKQFLVASGARRRDGKAISAWSEVCEENDVLMIMSRDDYKRLLCLQQPDWTALTSSVGGSSRRSDVELEFSRRRNDALKRFAAENDAKDSLLSSSYVNVWVVCHTRDPTATVTNVAYLPDADVVKIARQSATSFFAAESTLPEELMGKRVLLLKWHS